MTSEQVLVGSIATFLITVFVYFLDVLFTHTDRACAEGSLCHTRAGQAQQTCKTCMKKLVFHPLPILLIFWTGFFGTLSAYLPWLNGKYKRACQSCGGGEELVCTASFTLTEWCTDCSATGSGRSSTLSCNPLSDSEAGTDIQFALSFAMFLAFLSFAAIQFQALALPKPVKPKGVAVFFALAILNLVAFIMAMANLGEHRENWESLFASQYPNAPMDWGKGAGFWCLVGWIPVIVLSFVIFAFFIITSEEQQATHTKNEAQKSMEEVLVATEDLQTT